MLSPVSVLSDMV